MDVEITADFCFATGVAFARFLQNEREPGTVVIGEDMRPSSSVFADAFSAGVTSQGLNVIRIGLASTDLLYFAAGKLNFPGAMFTASHNPAEYNGIKLCLSGARPIGKESGLLTIERFVAEGSPIDFRSVGKTTGPTGRKFGPNRRTLECFGGSGNRRRLWSYQNVPTLWRRSVLRSRTFTLHAQHTRRSTSQRSCRNRPPGRNPYPSPIQRRRARFDL